MFVRNVVGEFQFVESDNLGHPLFPGSRAVWVNVHSLRHFGVSLSCHHPPRIVKFIPTVISSYNVHQQNVFGFFIQPRTPYFKWRKHSPTRERKRQEKKKKKSLKILGLIPYPKRCKSNLKLSIAIKELVPFTVGQLGPK